MAKKIWTDDFKRQGKDGLVYLPKSNCGMWFIRAYIGIALMILATWAGWAVIAIVRGGQ